MRREPILALSTHPHRVLLGSPILSSLPRSTETRIRTWGWRSDGMDWSGHRQGMSEQVLRGFPKDLTWDVVP